MIVTHGEMILNRTVNKLIVFHRGRVEFIDGNYEYFLNKFGWDDEDSDSAPALSQSSLSTQKGASGVGEQNQELVSQ